MTDPEQDELRVLRERAYGPVADIHLDSKALQRLHELEARGAWSEATYAAEDNEQVLDVSPPSAEEQPAPADEADVPPAPPRRSPFQVRRSTFLIVLALIALIVVSYAALEIVQRVQADPRDAGASQVARLSEDAAYEAPVFFSNGSADPPRAYEDFHGLRASISDGGTGTDDKCIVVFVPETGTDSDATRPVYMSCAAGAFPAVVAFRVDATFPEQLRSAFPDGTALQFVFDESGNEIVVFADEGGVRAAARAAGRIYGEFESVAAMSSRMDSFPA